MNDGKNTEISQKSLILYIRTQSEESYPTMPKKEKVKGRDNEASLSSNRVNFLNSKQKKKDSVENQDFQNYESNINDDSN